MSTTLEEFGWVFNKYKWNENPYTWNEILAVVQVAQQIKGGAGYVEAYDYLEEKDKKRFITVIAKVKGNMELSQPNIYKEKKEVNTDIVVTADDIKLVVDTIVGIKIENINV